MKRITFSVLLLLSISTAFPQAVTTTSSSIATPVVGSYIWLQRTNLFPCNEDGTPRIGLPILCEVYQKFTVVAIKDNDAIIIIDLYKALKYQSKYNFLDSTLKNVFVPGNIAYFKVPVDQLNLFAVKNLQIKGSLAFGIINFPFKYRIQKRLGDFSGSFNFGAALGVNFGHKIWRKWSYTGLTSYSISNVNLDSISVNKNGNLLSTTNNYTAFSFSIGLMITNDNKIQAGIFIGWDVLSRVNQSTFDWKYQGKPWISVGFGYSIFSDSKAVESTTNNPPGGGVSGKQ